MQRTRGVYSTANWKLSTHCETVPYLLDHTGYRRIQIIYVWFVCRHRMYNQRQTTVPMDGYWTQVSAVSLERDTDFFKYCAGTRALFTSTQMFGVGYMLEC